MLVAVEQDRAVFTCIDPGMGTPGELRSWGTAHRPCWQMLRESGRRVEVVAVVWEQQLLDRAARVLHSWIAGDMTEADRELLALRQAISSADWDTVERWGGLDAALKKINQLKQETPALNGRGMIDDFRLWESTRLSSYKRATERPPVARVGGACFQTATTLFSQRAFPPRCGSGLSRNAALDAG